MIALAQEELNINKKIEQVKRKIDELDARQRFYRVACEGWQGLRNDLYKAQGELLSIDPIKHGGKDSLVCRFDRKFLLVSLDTMGAGDHVRLRELTKEAAGWLSSELAATDLRTHVFAL